MGRSPRQFGSSLALFAAAGAVVALHFAQYRHGADSRIRIHDNLDGVLATNAVLARSDVFTAPPGAVFEPLLGGIPRDLLPSETQLPLLAYRYLPASTAFIANELLMRLVALLGMAALLRRHALPRAPPWLTAGAALGFAWLPIWEASHLSIAGQPLLLCAVLDLRRGDARAASWLVVGLVPLCSSLVLVGFWSIPLLGLLVAWESWRRGRVHRALLGAWLLYAAACAVSEYRLVVHLLANPAFASHRIESPQLHELGLLEALGRARALFFGTSVALRSHASALQHPIVTSTAGLALLSLGLGRRRPGGGEGRDGRDGRRLVLVIGACALVSLLAGGLQWRGVERALDALGSDLLRTFDFSRVAWLSPALWSAGFALALARLTRSTGRTVPAHPKGRAGTWLAGALLVGQLGHALHTQLDLHARRPLSFRELYAPALFARIRDAIGRPPDAYRVASLGLLPSIALYNGFHTVDGYASSYPLEHKRAFRVVIARELEKSARLRRRFDDWGNRCYLFSSEIGTVLDHRIVPERKTVLRLGIDTEALYRLGARYVLSAVRVANHAALGLEPQGIFEGRDSPWRIHLYSVRAPAS